VDLYIDGEVLQGARADIGGDPKEPWVHIAWKYLFTAKDSWLGTTANLGSIGALYNLTMDPYEKGAPMVHQPRHRSPSRDHPVVRIRRQTRLPWLGRKLLGPGTTLRATEIDDSGDPDRRA
jgi:hypothetical protein